MQHHDESRNGVTNDSNNSQPVPSHNMTGGGAGGFSGGVAGETHCQPNEERQTPQGTSDNKTEQTNNSKDRPRKRRKRGKRKNVSQRNSYSIY